MILFRQVKRQHTYRDQLKIADKSAAKHGYQNQGINTDIVNDQYIKGGTRSACKEGDFT